MIRPDVIPRRLPLLAQFGYFGSDAQDFTTITCQILHLCSCVCVLGRPGAWSVVHKAPWQWHRADPGLPATVSSHDPAEQQQELHEDTPPSFTYTWSCLMMPISPLYQPSFYYLSFIDHLEKLLCKPPRAALWKHSGLFHRLKSTTGELTTKSVKTDRC